MGGRCSRPRRRPATPAEHDTKMMRMWIVLDAFGHAAIEDDMYRAALMQRLGIRARDLRILDPKLSYSSTILGRERAILVNFEHIKMIITAEEVLLRNPTQPYVAPIVEELRRRLPPAREEQGTCEAPSFEFRALEVALEAICSFLNARATELEAKAYPRLKALAKSKLRRSGPTLDQVRKVKIRVTSLSARVQKVRDELEKLLDDDDNMAELYLTRKRAGSGNTASPDPLVALSSKAPVMTRTECLTCTDGAVDDVEEVEMLLESYFMDIDGTHNKLNELCEYIHGAEHCIKVQLDRRRNRLFALQLLRIGLTLALAFFSVVTGIFGMNIPCPWKNGHAYMFKWVVLFATVLSLLVFSAIYTRIKRLVA